MATDYFRLLRIPQWIKNFFVFVPLLFSKHLMEWDYLSVVLLAFITFSLTASMVYVFNDLLDVQLDRQHPIKKNRPIASGKISPFNAKITIGVLYVIIVLLVLQLNWEFAAALSGYIVINFLYTIKLKEIMILDLFCIASGFMLRVLAGAYVADIYVSNWLILTTIFLALFLAVMKRRSELVAQLGNNLTRTVLKDYSEKFIDQISVIAASGLVVCYALYSISSRTIDHFNSRYFVLTTAFVVFGVFRYMYLVVKKSKGENPTEIMLTDLPMLLNTIIYIFVIIILIYFR
ncbi:MAG: decaprenyl-phosphate phosphoribosyltransferase [Melioribacteraceae bacterium]|nr:MAG: decaprenyl-phosphate phosphoribosyltransferase [Melioribacteraceae bacterium]